MSVSQPTSIVQQKKNEIMRKLLVFVFLTSFIWVKSSPIDLDSDFDQLDTDLANLSYPVEEEDLDNYSEFLDDNNQKSKSKAKASRAKKKNAVKKGAEKTYSIEDLQKIFQTSASHDAGAKNDGEVYGFLKGLFSTGLGVGGNESRTYKKGTKTRGYHRVQHKDEYKKDNEFYEEDETNGVIKKVGAKGSGLKVGGGAAFDQGYFHHDRHKSLGGKQGLSDVGSSKKQYNGYSDSEGLKEYFQIEK